MLSLVVSSLLASVDHRSIGDRMNEPKPTVGLLSSNPARSLSTDATDSKLSWSSFRGSFRQELGDVVTGVTLNQRKHADFFHTASVAKRVVDSESMKLDAQLTHDFATQDTKLEASLLTSNGVRVNADVDRGLNVGRIGVSKQFNDVPLSKHLGDRLTISPSLDVNARELTLELQQDVGSNVRAPAERPRAPALPAPSPRLRSPSAPCPSRAACRVPLPPRRTC